MKQLFRSGNATTLFFKDETTLEDIRDWLSVNIHTGNDMFGLNEPHTATVKIYVDDILISGDEDFVEITFETITPIDILVYEL